MKMKRLLAIICVIFALAALAGSSALGSALGAAFAGLPVQVVIVFVSRSHMGYASLVGIQCMWAPAWLITPPPGVSLTVIL